MVKQCNIIKVKATFLICKKHYLHGPKLTIGHISKANGSKNCHIPALKYIGIVMYFMSVYNRDFNASQL